MTRVYVPATVRDLAQLHQNGSLRVGEDAVVAPDDDEETEYDALLTAADAAAELAAGLDPGRRRRVVVVAEVAGSAEQVETGARVSLADVVAVHADTRDVPEGECLLFDGRVHTYEAVDRRINNVVRGLIEVGVRQGAHVGVLMETRPSALGAIAALSRLGAVAVLMPPDVDLTAAARLGAGSSPAWAAV